MRVQGYLRRVMGNVRQQNIGVEDFYSGNVNLDLLYFGALMSFSQNFLEGLILLALTAGLSGFLVPYILKQIDGRKLREQKFVDERRLREQKEFDANLVRQNKIIDAQAQLLDTLVQLLWEFQLLVLSVSYYKLHQEQEKYEVAFREYDEKAWMYFGKIRGEISKAVRLTSNDVYQALLNFYTNCLIHSDVKLVTLVRKDASREEWNTHHNFIFQSLTNEIDEIVSLLAEELKLSSRTKQSNNRAAPERPDMVG